MHLGTRRTIAHAVYALVSSLAVLRWRAGSALLNISRFSYQSTDWLVNPADGGLWALLGFISGPEGVFGLTLWHAFAILALGLFGFARILRIVYPWRAVEPMKLLFFAMVTFLFIGQGGAALQSAEAARGQATNLILNAMSAAGTGGFDFGSPGAGSEPMPPPADLDGAAPIRAWEVVATTYFLVSDLSEVSANLPPADFRLTYCLFDPTQPIPDQTAAGPDGCSPERAWDEWDFNTAWTLPGWLGGGSVTLPIYNEHPDNRELAIRDAQAGVSRLALGLPVALFPVLEAQVGLMLTLAAGFIYLTLPVALFFAFFRFAESMPTRLLLQYITVFARTVIIHGLVAVFLALLIGAAATGDVATYLGIIGVGLLGGWFLLSMAMSTMRETLSQALGVMSGVISGVSTGAFGAAGRKPARRAGGAV